MQQSGCGNTSIPHQHYCNNYQVFIQTCPYKIWMSINNCDQSRYPFIIKAIKYITDHFILKLTNSTMYYLHING